jgi:hypothetical protein
VLGSASDALARASGLTPDTRYARLKNEVDEDAAAAGVLIFSIGAAAVGGIIFVPRLLALL